MDWQSILVVDSIVKHVDEFRSSRFVSSTVGCERLRIARRTETLRRYVQGNCWSWSAVPIRYATYIYQLSELLRTRHPCIAFGSHIRRKRPSPRTFTSNTRRGRGMAELADVLRHPAAPPCRPSHPCPDLAFPSAPLYDQLGSVFDFVKRVAIVR